MIKKKGTQEWKGTARRECCHLTNLQVTAFYTAQLTAVLTTQERRLPVSSLAEIQASDCSHLIHTVAFKTKYSDTRTIVQADSSASWLAVGGGALETIINTWPEFSSSLRADISSGKGTLVNSQDFALDKVRVDEGIYFLADSESIRDIVFEDYMKQKDPSDPLCGLTYTENFK